MTDLSPAAQAVLKAGGVDQGWPIHRKAIAAALEAVADQLLPEPDYWDEDNMSQQGLLLLRLKRAQLLAIAAELRGTTTTETL
jgi:hypothetical protein